MIRSLGAVPPPGGQRREYAVLRRIACAGAVAAAALAAAAAPSAGAAVTSGPSWPGAPQQSVEPAVHGVVVDSASGEPLPAAVVRLAELNRQDLTHDDGAFHLLRVTPGTYTLVVERLGYRTVRRDLEVPESGVPRLVVRMRASAIDLPGLIVTATMGARSREEALRPTQVMSGRDLQRHLDVTLARTIEGEAGVASGSMGPAPARPVIRGLGGDRILILEDGERVGDVSSSSADHAVSVESASAERVEMVRGPAALFYGSNALGGVINVVREEIPAGVPDHPTGFALVQAQSVNRGGAASGTYRTAFGPVGVRAEASGRWAGDVRTPEGRLPNTDIGTYSGALGAAWIGGFGHAGASVRGYRSTYGIPPDPVAGHPGGVTIDLERETLRGEALLPEAGGLGTVTVTGAYTRYDHREIEASGEVGTAFGQNTGTAEAMSRHGALGPFDAGGFGVRGQWQSYESNTGQGRIVRSRTYSGAVYAMEELDYDPLRLQFGARFDLHHLVPLTTDDVRDVPVRDRTFRNVSGSVAALYEIARGWRIGGSVARAFRAPSSEELFSQGPHLAAYTYEVGNPELAAETGLGLDAFIRVERPGISAEAAAFWNEIADYSYPANTGTQQRNLFVYRFQNTNARFVGGEISARWNVSGDLVLDGDVSYVRATNVDDDEPLPLIPPLNGRVVLRYDRDRWFVEGGWRGAAPQDRVPERPPLPDGSPGYCDDVPDNPFCLAVPGEFLATDGYAIVNAGLGYRWFPGHQVHSITLRLDNLTNRAYRNHLSRIKELSPEPGFGATLSYRVSF